MVQLKQQAVKGKWCYEQGIHSTQLFNKISSKETSFA